jgi:hypothetical protein
LLSNDADPDVRAEGAELLRELYETNRWYHKAWYVRRDLGAEAWWRGQAARRAGDEATALEVFRDAARFYSAALRARPKFRFFAMVRIDDQPVWQAFLRYPPNPLLRGNALDAHRESGHRWRATWHGRRLARQRKRMLRAGLKFFARALWHRAYARFDWVVIGVNDLMDTYARVYRAVALRQMGKEEQAEAEWQSIRDADPFALLTRALMLRDTEAHPLDRGLPGTETTDLDVIARALGLPPEALRSTTSMPF